MNKFEKKGKPQEETSELDQMCNEIKNKVHDHVDQRVWKLSEEHRDRANSLKRQLDASRISSTKARNIEINNRHILTKQLNEALDRIEVLTARLEEAKDIPTVVEAIEAK